MVKNLFLFFILISVFSYSSAADQVAVAKNKMNSLNEMRQQLARSLDQAHESITADTFKAVCMPVGKELTSWSEKNNYAATQYSHKPRNKSHSIPKQFRKYYNKFEKNKDLEFLVVSDELDNKKGQRLFYRVPIVNSCLHCHGSKDSRPDFIVKKYPTDKAFNFKVGDLRGVYSVFIPAYK